MKTLLLLALAIASYAQVAIDSGAASDQFFTGGAAWTPATSGYEPLGAPPLDTLRYGAAFSYSIPTGPGLYRVRLTMMENRSTGIVAGQRVFSVAVNGLRYADLDLFAIAGPKKAYTLEALTVSTGAVRVEFKATKGNAVVSNVEVLPLMLTDLAPGAITGGSVRLVGGKYVDVYNESNADYKAVVKGIAATDNPRSVPLAAVKAERLGYTGPMIAYVGNDAVLRSAIMANGTVSVELGPDVPSVVAFGFPAMRFSERLTWTLAERWIFTTRPNPANSISVTKNGNRLMQGSYALSWSDPAQLPDALIIPGTLPNDIILVDYVAGGVPAVPGAAASVQAGIEWATTNY